jgi:hypothetical protein
MKSHSFGMIARANNDPIRKKDNVATFFTAPDYQNFEAFCTTAELDYQQEQNDPIIAHETLIVSDDDDDDDDQIESTNKSTDKELIGI